MDSIDALRRSRYLERRLNKFILDDRLMMNKQTKKQKLYLFGRFYACTR